MSNELTTSQLRQLRLRSQRLLGEPLSDPVQIVRDVFAIQSQDAAAGLLAVRARGTGFTAADVERMRNDAHALVRTWAMRGTLHLMASQDYAWVLPYLAKRGTQHTSKRRIDLGLTDAVLEKAIPAVRDALADGALTRAELADRLRPLGIPVEGQAIAHLVGMAAYAGVLCYGADIGSKHGHALLSDWATIDWDAPLEGVPARLAERYLRAYAPAAPQDFAVWAGIPISEAKAAFHKISDRLVEVTSEGESLWMHKERAAWLDDLHDEWHVVKLLPMFDATLLGYKSRDWYLAPEYIKPIFPGGGMLLASLLVDGRLIGKWTTRKIKSATTIVVEAFEPLSDSAMAGLESEVSDIGQFLGVSTKLEVI